MNPPMCFAFRKPPDRSQKEERMPPRVALASAARVSVMLALVSGCAAAQTFPIKPIRLVLPFPPGGGTDALARIIGPKLARGSASRW